MLHKTMNAATSEAITSIMKVLGLPKRVKSFTLQATVGETPTVTCTYFVEQEGGMFRPSEVTRRFELRPLEDEEVYVSQPVPFR